MMPTCFPGLLGVPYPEAAPRLHAVVYVQLLYMLEIVVWPCQPIVDGTTVLIPFGDAKGYSMGFQVPQKADVDS